MPLTTCAECSKEISDLAAVCPNCGCPNQKTAKKEMRKLGVNLTTIQQTSKKLKSHKLIAIGLVILGILIIAILSSHNNQLGLVSSFISSICIAGGIILFIVTRVRIWWHHK